MISISRYPSRPLHLNLRTDPHATLQVKDKIVETTASFAAGEEYERLWQVVTGRNPLYNRYKQQTRRQIPLAVFTPQ